MPDGVYTECSTAQLLIVKGVTVAPYTTEKEENVRRQNITDRTPSILKVPLSHPQSATFASPKCHFHILKAALSQCDMGHIATSFSHAKYHKDMQTTIRRTRNAERKSKKSMKNLVI